MRNTSFTIATLILLLVTSCSTNEVKKIDASPKVQDEFSHLSNDNFLAPDPILLDDSEDYFKDADDDVLTAQEGLHFASAKELDSFEDHTLDGILGACYQKNFDKFTRVFKKINRKYRKNPSFWNNVGSCLLLQGKFKKALLYYNKSRILSEQYAPPVNNLGVIYQLEGSDEKALLAYKKASTLSSFSITPLINQAQIYTKYRLFEKAKKVMVRLYEMNENDPTILSNFAYISLVEKNYNRAINLYSKLDSEYQKKPGIALNFALALAKKNENEEAIKVIQKMNEPRGSALKSYYKEVTRYLKMDRKND